MEHRRSIFGPLLLIATGVVWLLVKAGTIPAANLWALTHIWPFLLIAAGVGIILRPYFKYTNILLDVLIIGGAVFAIVYAPNFNWARPTVFFASHRGEPYFGPTELGSGKVMEQARTVSGFDKIEIEYPAEVVITQGGREALVIEAEDNVIPGLVTAVSDGKLKIYYEVEDGDFVAPTKPVKISITAKTLREVEFSSAGKLVVEGFEASELEVSLSGAGSLVLNDVHVEELKLTLSGAGDITASGTADKLDLDMSGVGDFDGSNLQTKIADITVSGAGSATVWVDEKLDATLSGAGSISYYGDASVTKQISGVGNVKPLGDK
jgi:hypothetical protein